MTLNNELFDPVAGSPSQLHVLIPQAPCQAPTCCQASPDSRSAPVLKPISFCFLFIFSQFPQNSRAAWSGHNCRIWGVEGGRELSCGSMLGVRSSPYRDEDMQTVTRFTSRWYDGLAFNFLSDRHYLLIIREDTV